MRSFSRAGLVALVLAAAFWALFVALLGWRLLSPSDSARLPPGASQPLAGGLIVAPLRSNGLRSNDLVIAVDGRSIADWAQDLTSAGQPSPRWAFGQTLTYTVLRRGVQIDVPVVLETYPLDAIFASDWAAMFVALAMQLVFGFVFLRRPHEPVAQVMFFTASCMVAATAWSFGLQITDIVDKTGFWLHVLATTGAYLLVWVGALHAILLFPTPWPPLKRHRWIAVALYTAPFLTIAVVTLAQSPANALEWSLRTGGVVNSLQLVYVLLAMAAAVRSYRVARDPESKAQVRWVVTAFIFVFFCNLALGIIPQAVLGYSFVSWNVLALIGLLIPLAFAFAILRYRLFEIDVILNRMLVYGTLTVAVSGLYVVVVGALSTFLQLQNNLTISLMVTAIVAVAFQPVRDGLQRAVNRFMYGERDNPYAVLSRLGRQLESTLAPGSVLPTIVETVAQTLKLPYAAITLREAGSDVLAAAYGLPSTRTIMFPLDYQNDLIGHLHVGQRSSTEPFSPTERQLLEDITRQIEVAVHNVRLTADLQRSRERLVTAREEERRRIRRGPKLAAQTLNLEAAIDALDRNPEAARLLLTGMMAESQSVVVEIRRLVYGLRPPALDELGLVGALAEQAARYSHNGLLVTVSAPDSLPPLPAATEVAAYRIVQEALTNVARHAVATTCTVSIAVHDAVRLVILDDGRGLPPIPRAGLGLNSMRERAEEIGGTCVIEAGSAGGTRVAVRLPLSKP